MAGDGEDIVDQYPEGPMFRLDQLSRQEALYRAENVWVPVYLVKLEILGPPLSSPTPAIPRPYRTQSWAVRNPTPSAAEISCRYRSGCVEANLLALSSGFRCEARLHRK